MILSFIIFIKYFLYLCDFSNVFQAGKLSYFPSELSSAVHSLITSGTSIVLSGTLSPLSLSIVLPPPHSTPCLQNDRGCRIRQRVCVRVTLRQCHYYNQRYSREGELIGSE